MRRLRQPAQIATSQLRLAIRQVFARPLLTGSLLMVLAPSGQALTLGDINVRSTLGQHLDATIPVRLGSGEALASGCVQPSYQTADLRRVPGTEVTTPEASRDGLYELRITSAAALYEPLYELELKVQCPGAPALIRQYVLMLDLPAAVTAGATTASLPAATATPDNSAPAAPVTSATESAEPVTASPAPVQRRSTARPVGATLEPGARYRVAEGDTLSSIAARVRSWTVSLRALASAIQAANPDAFIRNDANLIKLGSEILIPAAAAPVQPAPASTADAGPTAVAPPEPAAETAIPAPGPEPLIAAAPVPALAAAPLPVAAVAETARPAVLPPAPVARRAPAEAPVAVATEVDEPNPVLAAGAGILFGLIISGLLWAFGRRTDRQRPVAKAASRQEAQPPFGSTALATAITTAAAPLVTRALEPAFTVSYSPPAEDTLASEFAGGDVTSELEELFDSTDTNIQKRLNAEKTQAARSLLADPEDAYAPVVIEPARNVDFLVGEPTDAEATSQSGTVDIHALAASATKDQQQAQTLLEALTLLERDYEEELTARQVLDMSAVRQALGKDLDEATQISETNIRAASARKRAR